jgi:phosphomannomutase
VLDTLPGGIIMLGDGADLHIITGGSVANKDLMVGVSGIRGIVFDPLSTEVASQYAAALATLLGVGTYVVGRDTRPSGDVLSPSVAASLASCGCDVIDVGVAPTPTIQLAVEYHKAQGGIAITASHNPAEWNALKLISGGGTFLVHNQVDVIKTIVMERGFAYGQGDKTGRVSNDDGAIGRHIDGIMDLDFVDAGLIGGAGFKVAVDCVNGAGSDAVPLLLDRLGCEVVTLDCEGNGDFRRNPEPVGANLGGLCEVVRDSGADVGFAVDPDADRLSIVDETGAAIGEEYSIVLCSELILSKTGGSGPVVVNLSTTRAVGDVASRHGAELLRAPIGEINVVGKMKEVGSPIGGEGNGGIILPALHYGRDSLVGIALVLELLAERKEKLSKLMTLLPRYAILKTKAPLRDIADISSLKPHLVAEFEGATLNDEDGLRFDLSEGWVHLRKSGTEPVVRIIAEGRDGDAAQALIDRCRRAIGS